MRPAQIMTSAKGVGFVTAFQRSKPRGCCSASYLQSSWAFRILECGFCLFCTLIHMFVQICVTYYTMKFTLLFDVTQWKGLCGLNFNWHEIFWPESGSVVVLLQGETRTADWGQKLMTVNGLLSPPHMGTNGLFGGKDALVLVCAQVQRNWPLHAPACLLAAAGLSLPMVIHCLHESCELTYYHDDTFAALPPPKQCSCSPAIQETVIWIQSNHGNRELWSNPWLMEQESNY